MNLPSSLAWTILSACVAAAVYFGVQNGTMQATLRHQSSAIETIRHKVEALEGGNGAIIRMQADMDYLKREMGELTAMVRAMSHLP